MVSGVSAIGTPTLRPLRLVRLQHLLCDRPFVGAVVLSAGFGSGKFPLPAALLDLSEGLSRCDPGASIDLLPLRH